MLNAQSKRKSCYKALIFWVCFWVPEFPTLTSVKDNTLHFFLFGTESVIWNFSTVVSIVFLQAVLMWHFFRRLLVTLSQWRITFHSTAYEKLAQRNNITQNYLSVWDTEHKSESHVAAYKWHHQHLSPQLAILRSCFPVLANTKICSVLNTFSTIKDN